jgi:hypothetical protein
MEVLHTGLDGLDMAVRCRIPDGLDAFLTAAKCGSACKIDPHLGVIGVQK